MIRTRQKIANKGVHQSLIEWTMGKIETNGFTLLVEAGMPEFTGQYIVTKVIAQPYLEIDGSRRIEVRL